MNLGDAANLIINLKLNDQASRAIAGVKGKLAGLEGGFGRIGSMAKKGIGTAIGNLAKLGAAAGVAGLALGVSMVKSGLESLATLEDATTAVGGAIKQMGLTGKLTAEQIAGWANDIETNVGAAFDDKDILASAETLIRYGKIAPTALQPAMQVMTDLATKTGSVDSAAGLLAKALAAPEAAAGKLARAGVILTEAQQAQIEAMVEAGDVAGAQTVLLDALSEATEGAAKSSQGPYRTAISMLKDTWEDVTRALATGFLPIIQEVSTYLQGKLADEGFLNKVKDFGQKLAGFLKEGLDAAKNIPWDSIGSAMKLAGQGAKAAYDMFMGMPEWVKTAVITGWGLNKLTGGALGGIVGELGKGLIKGVLGMTAGIVNIKAGVVHGVGGGIPPAAGAGAAGLGLGAAAVGVTAGAVAGGVLATVVTAPIVDAVNNQKTAVLTQQGYSTDQITRLLELDRQEERVRQSRNSTYIQEQTARINAAREAIMALPEGITRPIGSNILTLGSGLIGAAVTTNQMLDSVRARLAPLDPIAAATSGALNALNGKIEVTAPGLLVPLNQVNTGLGRFAGDFTTRWGALRDQLHAQFGQGSQLRSMLAEKLGISTGKLDQLHRVMRSEVASKLGITVDELRNIKRSSNHNEQAIAAKLGISVEQLRAIREKAREHAALQVTTNAKLEAIKNKNWSPRIVVPSGSFGGINPMTGKPWGQRQHGGPVQAGSTYLVGEKGPELLHMGRTNGYVQPNTQGWGGGVSRQPIQVNITNQIVLNTRTIARELDRSQAITLARPR